MSARRKAKGHHPRVLNRTRRLSGKDFRKGRVYYAPCVECGCIVSAPVDGSVIYPDRPHLHRHLYYLCKCGAYVGTHKKGGHPLGYPAGGQTRYARSRAHSRFDPIWTSGLLSRDEAYAWLASAMGLTRAECHISKLGKAQADRVTRLSEEYIEAHATEEQKAVAQKSANAFDNWRKELRRDREKADVAARAEEDGQRARVEAHQAGGGDAVPSVRRPGDGASRDRVCGQDGQGQPQ